MDYKKPLRHVELDQKEAYLYETQDGKTVSEDVFFEDRELDLYGLKFLRKYTKYSEAVKNEG